MHLPRSDLPTTGPVNDYDDERKQRKGKGPKPTGQLAGQPTNRPSMLPPPNTWQSIPTAAAAVVAAAPSDIHTRTTRNHSPTHARPPFRLLRTRPDQTRPGPPPLPNPIQPTLLIFFFSLVCWRPRTLVLTCLLACLLACLPARCHPMRAYF
ncbi:hypothetical protein BS50DRAFT_186848 [Corynespora cassiicola Philippines]|uniref:Uncharacterized protein n=1 Tax=Corynespora cassiicola Philippines TaxID=1448308 RepID=A0A2T2P7X2_CORCC|nr:hypothetical protein BS50DRAFT_186848 [Corynespora cassiicola Philippines]